MDPPRSLMLTSPSNATIIPMSETIMDPPQSSTISQNLPPLGGEINSEDEQKEKEPMCPGLDHLHDTQEREHDVNENSAVPTSPENYLAMVLYESCTPVQIRQDPSLDWQNVNPLLSGCFNPCTCHVLPGEDVVEKLKAFFAQLGGLSACVVDAMGYVSTFHTRNLAQPDGILKLEGSFMLENINATYSFFELPLPRERMVRFSILVGDEHGTLIGGEVAGPLIAASPVQVVLCTFDQRNARESGMLEEAGPSTASCSSSADER
ncbi:hypothetical protein Nepgr_009154 [Nepenthes gracilis]|uniref:AT-hook motif nuclear-localized protein n=1 Tax=Nepenthes gracilis TaxID=150966 RepID=A0AAD3SAV4_NEPGR|nr:hypothetical protein Nepgr_009154 [Nepenthes gracilis]